MEETEEPAAPRSQGRMHSVTVVAMWCACAWAVFGLAGLAQTTGLGGGGPQGWYKLFAPMCQAPTVLLVGAGALAATLRPRLRTVWVLVPLLLASAAWLADFHAIGQLPGGGC
jgi:hypothetical protein